MRIMSRDVCAFCKKEIVPPMKGFRNGARGTFLCEDCIKLTYQSLMAHEKKIKPVRRAGKRMTPKEMKRNLINILLARMTQKLHSQLQFITIIKDLILKVT